MYWDTYLPGVLQSAANLWLSSNFAFNLHMTFSITYSTSSANFEIYLYMSSCLMDISKCLTDSANPDHVTQN